MSKYKKIIFILIIGLAVGYLLNKFVFAQDMPIGCPPIEDEEEWIAPAPIIPIAPINNNIIGVPRCGEAVDWVFDRHRGASVFPFGIPIRIIDPATGKSFIAKRTGGRNHADLETIDTTNTEIMRKMCRPLWIRCIRRAVLVEIGGRLIAASMYGVPHGYDSILGNGMRGHFCIHFRGSRTHGRGGGRLDTLHQRGIRRITCGI